MSGDDSTGAAAAAFHSFDPLRQRLGEELVRYGLPVPTTDDAAAWERAFTMLLTHVYSNHALALAVADETVRLLSEGD